MRSEIGVTETAFLLWPSFLPSLLSANACLTWQHTLGLGKELPSSHSYSYMNPSCVFLSSQLSTPLPTPLGNREGKLWRCACVNIMESFPSLSLLHKWFFVLCWDSSSLNRIFPPGNRPQCWKYTLQKVSLKYRVHPQHCLRAAVRALWNIENKFIAVH